MTTLLVVLAVVVLLALLGFNIIGAGLTVLWMLLVGLVIGALARLVVPGRQSFGLLLTALLGAAGALVGGMIARAAFDAGELVQFLTSVLVAAVFVAVAAALDRESGETRRIDRA